MELDPTRLGTSSEEARVGKVYPGYAHGAIATHHDVINSDILDFIKS